MSIDRIRKKVGLPPGSVVFTGIKKVDKPFVHILTYNEKLLENLQPDSDKLIEFPEKKKDIFRWIDLRGLHDTKIITNIGEQFNLHPLILEDIANTHQRPKIEEYENGIFLIIKALSYIPSTRKIKMEQVAIFLGDGFVLSFQEDKTDLFLHIRERIEIERSRVRKSGPDYLTYALLDLITDHYFLVLDQIEDSIELSENKILTNPDEDTKAKIHALKRQVIRIRKFVNPLREAISRFYRIENPFIKEDTKVYLRDLYDHTIIIMDMIESYRDTLNGLQDLYLSELSFRMNKVMQLLTIISTIFIPLGFLAGLYGMNFTNMPELQWRYGYFVLLSVMGVIFIGSLVYFKRKDWL